MGKKADLNVFILRMFSVAVLISVQFSIGRCRISFSPEQLQSISGFGFGFRFSARTKRNDDADKTFTRWRAGKDGGSNSRAEDRKWSLVHHQRGRENRDDVCCGCNYSREAQTCCDLNAALLFCRGGRAKVRPQLAAIIAVGVGVRGGAGPAPGELLRTG